jgi:O-antigen ligase
MLKAILYLSATAAGISATFITPFAGVLTCFAAYLMNPAVIKMSDGGFRYQFWTTLALLASFVLHRPGRSDESGSEVWAIRLMWAYVAFAALTASWAVVTAQVALDSVYEVLKTVLLVAIMVRIVQTERQLTMLVNVFIIGVCHAAILHIFGVRWNFVPSVFSKEYGVLPDSQTAVMVLFLPLIILTAIFGNRVQKILSCCTLPLALDSVVETYERTGFVAIALEVLLLLIYLPRRITLRILPVLVLGAALFALRLTPQNYWEKMATIQNPTEEASANGRFIINHASRRIFQDYPMGVGYRNYPYISPRYLPDEMLTWSGDQRLRSAHNSYFTVLCETGVIGFAIWIAMFAFTVRMFRQLRKQKIEGVPPLAVVYGMAFEVGLYGWAIAGWTQSYHEVDPAYWFVGCAVVTTRICRAYQPALETVHSIPAAEQISEGPKAWMPMAANAKDDE